MSCARYLGTYHVAARSAGTVKFTANVALGESTAGEGTGILGNGVALSSVSVSQGTKPTGADSLTFGAPAAFTVTTYVDGVAYGANEGFSVLVTLAAAQAAGTYHMDVLPVLDNSDNDTIPGYCVIKVTAMPT